MCLSFEPNYSLQIAICSFSCFIYCLSVLSDLLSSPFLLPSVFQSLIRIGFHCGWKLLQHTRQVNTYENHTSPSQGTHYGKFININLPRCVFLDWGGKHHIHNTQSEGEVNPLEAWCDGATLAEACIIHVPRVTSWNQYPRLISLLLEMVVTRYLWIFNVPLIFTI